MLAISLAQNTIVVVPLVIFVSLIHSHCCPKKTSTPIEPRTQLTHFKFVIARHKKKKRDLQFRLRLKVPKTRTRRKQEKKRLKNLKSHGISSSFETGRRTHLFQVSSPLQPLHNKLGLWISSTRRFQSSCRRSSASPPINGESVISLPLTRMFYFLGKVYTLHSFRTLVKLSSDLVFWSNWAIQTKAFRESFPFTPK